MADVATVPVQALAATTPGAAAIAPKSVVLLVDPNQVRTMRNTFVFWEFVTLGLGIYIGKKVFEPAPTARVVPRGK
jgi:hypothetical protein